MRFLLSQNGLGVGPWCPRVAEGLNPGSAVGPRGLVATLGSSCEMLVWTPLGRGASPHLPMGPGQITRASRLRSSPGPALDPTGRVF
ncbi:hypothetical protein CB1_000831009 [Camelus ferus]|nr:hypothetical protein CB1_000831009 [Camelus ferus]